MILLLDILDLGQVPYFSQLQFPHLEKVKWDGPCALWGSPKSRSVTNSLGPSCDGWSFGLVSKGFPKLQDAAYPKVRGGGGGGPGQKQGCASQKLFPPEIPREQLLPVLLTAVSQHPP